MPAVSQLLSFLAKGWEQKCLELGIIKRQRGIKTPGDLMMLNLFHLLNGCSLLEISEAGRLLNIGKFSDVAFMKRFEQCGEWFAWNCGQFAQRAVAQYQKPEYLKDYRVIAFDASDVVEKGCSGQRYRLHYGIDIFNMCTVSYKITRSEVGEALRNFPLQRGDLAIGDRAYGTVNGIDHCVKSGADFILRLRANGAKLYDDNGKAIDIVSKFQDLESEECGCFQAFVRMKVSAGDITKVSAGDIMKDSAGDITKVNAGDITKVNAGDITKVNAGDIMKDSAGDITKVSTGDITKDSTCDKTRYEMLPVRVCVKRKSDADYEQTLKKLKRRESRKQCKVMDETKQFNRFIVVLTSLPQRVSAYDVLETYRYRWQIEIYFKRLKSIMDLGELPKKREKSSLAWINGKIMVALMIELFLSSVAFSPRGQENGKPQHLA